MALARRPAGGVVAGQADADNVKTELLGLGEQLKARIDIYEERPSVIDSDILGTTDGAADVEAMITKIYRTMKRQVFADESPLRVDTDFWEAFREQQDEFMEFYRSALNAVEVHKEVLQYYQLVKSEARQRLRHGDLEGIRQDNYAYVAGRDECIAAVGHFSGKFSAMLIVLSS